MKTPNINCLTMRGGSIGGVAALVYP